MRSLHHTASAVSRKVGYPSPGLVTRIGRLLLLPTDRPKSFAIVVSSKFFGRFGVVN